MVKEINLFDAPPGEEIPLTGTYVQEKLPGILEKLEAEQEKERLEKQNRRYIKRIIEALLFSSAEAISFSKIHEITDEYFPCKPRAVREIIQELQNEYLSEQRSFRIDEIAQGYILRSCEEYAPYIEKLFRNKRSEKLSQAASEVLAIIAYKQPITAPQIERIRGVDSSGTIYSLLERGLIEPLGKLEAPGRPILYGVTREFLQYFGLKDLSELPQIQ